jgi:(1->4)-alpha-D-glucan 1-alpha-D-glucosylmutase
VHTSWVNPNEAYDRAVRDFVLGVLNGADDTSFLEELLPLLRRVAYFGQFNALSQVLLKLTSPGVPDIYQGSELWDFSLVDPDNRRPVDYAQRRAALADVKAQIARSGSDLRALAGRLLGSSADGRIKLYVIERTLKLRRAHAALCTSGTYGPLETLGAKAAHVCAFLRSLGDEASITVVPRMVVGLADGAERPPIDAEIWQDTWLALPDAQVGRRYRNVMTGETLVVERHSGAAGLPLAALCRHFPVACLITDTDAR